MLPKLYDGHFKAEQQRGHRRLRHARTGKRSSLGVLGVPAALSPTPPPALRSLKDTACSRDTRQLLTAAACPLLNPASRVSHAWATRSSEFPVDLRAALAMVAAMRSREREGGRADVMVALGLLQPEAHLVHSQCSC